MTDLADVERPLRRVHSFDLYRAVWRWHFYAGLFCLPFLIMLSITGGLYLFRDGIDNFVHRDVKFISQQSVPQKPPSEIVAAATASVQGTPVQYTPPASPDASAEVSVKTPAGERLSVFVNPYSGEVLGTIPFKGTVMWIIRQIHSLGYFGPIANGVIEIVGGWAILLVVTGLYLWWPRKQAGGVLSVRGTPKSRIFWRDTHAVTGAISGFFIVFLAVSGMPWSVFWGDKVNEWANGTNYGYPSGVYVGVPVSDEHMNHVAPTPWSLEQAQIPMSHQAGQSSAIGLDAAVAKFESMGLSKGFAVGLPQDKTGVYSATVYPDDLSQQRIVHLDQYSGQPLIDMSYADYGPFAKAMEWGINTHMGQEFGLINQIVMLVVCLAIITLAVSSGVMWWKRRPKGSLGVPPMPADRRKLYVVAAMLAIGGIIFPLVGLSLLFVLTLDLVVTSLPRRRGTVDQTV
ncbi:putative iron-regulated membrane protein [Rhodoligotrophos appendicifer]|uniref:PepSY-associated TM helix domain-containing protein n=1 Tax=Rhodoligotrophos appendicifer TaxID=987056 RepID=UPI001185FD55|nr:PepSY domain-containing protein [Rhodoligotrophos appendicifer]